jgi:hypothetical protein
MTFVIDEAVVGELVIVPAGIAQDLCFVYSADHIQVHEVVGFSPHAPGSSVEGRQITVRSCFDKAELHILALIIGAIDIEDGRDNCRGSWRRLCR